MELTGTHNHFAMEASNVRYIKGHLQTYIFLRLLRLLRLVRLLRLWRLLRLSRLSRLLRPFRLLRLTDIPKYVPSNLWT